MADATAQSRRLPPDAAQGGIIVGSSVSNAQFPSSDLPQPPCDEDG